VDDGRRGTHWQISSIRDEARWCASVRGCIPPGPEVPCADGSSSSGKSGRVSGQPKCGNVPNAEGRIQACHFWKGRTIGCAENEPWCSQVRQNVSI